jgi:hypothetical protein
MSVVALARRAVPVPALSRTKKRVALAIAAAADLAQIFLLPLFGEGALSPLDDALDLLTAVALVGILGFRWQTALAFALELVPGVALFPSWTAMVATLPASDDNE